MRSENTGPTELIIQGELLIDGSAGAGIGTVWLELQGVASRRIVDYSWRVIGMIIADEGGAVD